ncbi:hypothetical protein niasHS_008841 [Heterodera schachtii]|uniref:Uncharacterized protein n=1 Tax=Heterodera schachtii TaxID=97005 RepID=A0ABD2IVL4_HETSC
MHLFLAFSPFFLPLLCQNWAHSNDNELTLKITPSLLADEKETNLYYVQAYCMNRGKRFHPRYGTFVLERSAAAANEDKVTISFEQKEPCDYYEADVRIQSGSFYVPGWQIELLHSYEFYSKRNENVANGQTYVFSLANQQPKKKMTSEMTLDGEGQAAHQQQQKGFSQKRLASYVALSDSDESDGERKARRKSEWKDECYFYNI